MKYIHCADLHLDSKMTTKLSSEDSYDRRKELLETYSRMIEYAQDNDIQGIIIAGDLFDNDIISKVAYNVVWDSIVSNPDIIFYYLEGNHERDGFTHSLRYIPDNLKLFDEEWTTHYDGDNDQIAITGILNGVGIIDKYDELNLDRSLINIVVMHGQVYDNSSAKDYHAIHLPKLKDKGIDYLALGHIHSYKEEKLDSRGVYCYSGCLEGRGFDEVGQHGFVELDIDENEAEVKSRFVPFAKRIIENVYVDASKASDTAELITIIDEALKETSRDNMINIIIGGSTKVDVWFNIEYIEAKYNDTFYMARVEDNIGMTVDYNEYVYDETLRGEFVRLISESDVDEDMKADIIKCGMLALAGEVSLLEDN